jgi:hypothetical protein
MKRIPSTTNKKIIEPENEIQVIGFYDVVGVGSNRGYCRTWEASEKLNVLEFAHRI